MASPSLPGPPHGPPSTPSKSQVKSTRPTVPPNIDRAPIRTERLLIRPFEASDVEAIHVLRTQPEVMLWTSVGVVDKDIDQSRVFAERFLPPKDLDTYNFVIVYLGDAVQGEDTDGVLIGTAGAHNRYNIFGWPEVGYMFRKEYWNKGLGTEFLRGFLKAWWALPRHEIQVEVDAASVEGRGERNGSDVIQVPEILTAIIESNNIGSRRVLEKAGFREFKRWTEPDSRVGFEGKIVTLLAFLLEAPDSRKDGNPK
ncbi:acetyltransferase domain-containing protein [Xylaria sp. FL1777]|nr:acetyltransferase domain-containing protein [Xylaria sp. FL1777]